MLKNACLHFLLIVGLTACSSDDNSYSETAMDVSWHYFEDITVDGLKRTYTIYIPSGYYRNGNNYPLVIALHGGGGTAKQFEETSGLSEKARAQAERYDDPFIIVYPNGAKGTGALAPQTWNAGKCCDYARDNNIDDVNFIRQLIDKVAQKYRIDTKKVFATGHSNGGMLAYRLACEMPDKIAAIAVSSCTMVVTSPCNPSRPVPVLHMHSKLDTRVAYQGGVGITEVYYPPVDSVLNTWALKNACATSPVSTDKGKYTFTQWNDCSASSSVQLYLTSDGGHAWPGGQPGSANGDTPSTAISANTLLWDFFKAHPMP